MRATINSLLLLSCVALALAGCKRPAQEASTPPPTPAPTATTPAKPAISPAPVQPATVKSNPDMPLLRIDTIDGKTFALDAHRGQWVVVNFWATWCGPCLREMPDLSALDAMREHVDVIGLAYEDITPVDMQAFLRKHPVVYPVAIVDMDNPPADFATPRGLPTTFLIAPGGKLAKHFLGPVTAHDIDAAIAAAGGPKPAA